MGTEKHDEAGDECGHGVILPRSRPSAAGTPSRRKSRRSQYGAKRCYDRRETVSSGEPTIRHSATWLQSFAESALLRPSVIAFALFLIVVDFTTWIELDVASAYSIPLVLAALPRDRRFLWSLTLLLVAATFAVYALQIPHGTFTLREPYFINRALDVVGVVLTAGLLQVWIRSVEIREAQVRLLDEKNRELQAANAELVRREAQIAAQNEALELRRREAEEASGRKTRLLAAVSHDMRTPLSSIQLTAEVIRRTVADPALAVQIPGMAQRLQANAASLLEVASELVEIGSIDTGRVECHTTQFDLRDLVAEKCGDVLPLAHAKMLRLEIDAPANAVPVATDRAKLGRILSNLLANAVKFTRAGGVDVSLRTVGGDIVIEVTDTGIGIERERLELVFDEFARATDGREAGWGLGLAICRRLAGLLGGTITARSTPGAGSTFTFRMPASQRSVAVGRIATRPRPARPNAGSA